MVVISVSNETYVRIRYIRDKLRLKNIESVLVLLLDLYEDSLMNVHEVMLKTLSNTNTIIDLLNEIKTDIEKLQRLERVVVQQKPVTTVETPVPAGGKTVTDESLPVFIQDNPWVEILSSRGKE